MDLSPETLAAWKAEASEHPSGQRCNGVHSATPDARIVVLVTEIERLRSKVDPWREVEEQ